MSRLTSVADATLNWANQRNLQVVFSPETGSTNVDAKKNALDESDSLVLYLAAHQSAGRGRGQNTWLDTGSGECLLSTWSYRLASPPQSITGPRIGLAVFNAVHSVWPSLEWSLKAPNDLFLSGGKVGGLLIESVSSGDDHRILIGFGFNILNHPRKFSEAEHLGHSLDNNLNEGDWFQFLDELQKELASALMDILKPGLTDAACRTLTDALNANSNRPFVVQKVSPQGDLIHAKGQLRWMDL